MSQTAIKNTMKPESYLISDLLNKLPDNMIEDHNIDNISISGLTLDSRQVEKDFLFAAFQGEKVNGYDFIQDAYKKGAICVLIDGDALEPENIPYIKAKNPRYVFALLTAAFYGEQPEHIVAVTGTNGKTSIAQFCRQIWEQLDRPAASMGTLGIDAPSIGLITEGNITTPDTVSLHQNLQKLVAKGCSCLAMEASSHGLSQYRLHGLNIQAAGFTNLTHDHLDYHGTMENYLQAKMKLFTEILPKDGVAVLNADDPAFPKIDEICEKTFTYSTESKPSDLQVIERTALPTGQQVTLNAFGKEYEFFFPFVGEFQLANALCAAGLILAETNLDTEKVITCLQTLSAVRGRMEFVGTVGETSAAVYVDYAHTPDALLHVLQALRPHTNGRLVTIIGCGGDRDNKKRSVMGEVAEKHADLVIVTDDNPRSEDASVIREQVMKGCPKAENIGDRKQAIEHAINILENGDILVITGKGHEQGQKIGDTVLPFDDVVVAFDALCMLNTEPDLE